MNIFPKYRLLDKAPDDGGADGFMGANDSGLADDLPAGETESSAPSTFLRDITEDDAYEALRSAKNVPTLLQALESRVSHPIPQLAERMQSLEQALGQRVAFSPKLERSLAALNQYDPSGELGKSFVPALLEDLKEALQINQLDQKSIDPFVQPHLQQYNSALWEQMVGAMIGDSVAEAIPDTVDGKFSPTNARQKDFVEWYAQQNAPTQQALHSFGPAYIRAFRSFEKWEKDRIQERSNAAGASSSRLAGATSPSSRGQRAASPGTLKTEEEGFMSRFK